MARSKKREPLTFEQVQATFAEFQDSSDRAAAILSVSLLDAQLEEILTAFGADKTCLADILKPDQPLGSLGARRRLCLALGLISPDEASELSTLGKIRNELAHQLHGLAFNVEPIAGWVLRKLRSEHPHPRPRFPSSRSPKRTLSKCRPEPNRADRADGTGRFAPGPLLIGSTIRRCHVYQWLWTTTEHKRRTEWRSSLMKIVISSLTF